MKWCFAVVVWLFASLASAQPQVTNVHVVNSPNVLTWPITTHISQINVADKGVQVVFDKCEAWPKVTPPGWDGPLIYTVWLFEKIGDEWFGSGIIQFWACDQFNGGPIYQDNQIARNWVYDNRWSSMVGHQPAPGERIGFMVSAGNARGQDDHATQERSDIVEFAMPAGPTSVTSFLASEQQASSAPVVVPPPAPAPAAPAQVVVVPANNDAFYQSLVNARFDKIDAEIAALHTDEETHWSNVKSVWSSIVKSPYVQMAATAFATWLTTHQLTK